MPPSAIWNIEWLNQNSQRNYPLSEEASLLDTSGSFSLPLDLVVDLVWPVHATATIEPDKFHIYNLSIFGNGISLTLGYDGTPIGTVSVSADTHARNQSYFISGTGDFHDSVGKITIGELTNTMAAAGSYSFNLSGARLEPTVIRPDLRGVTGFVLVNGSDRSELLTGDVEFIAGRNFRLTPVINPGENSQIRFDAISGEGLNENCNCDNIPDIGEPIRTINGVGPDENGNFTLQGSDCMQIQASGTGLSIEDVCSNPCCGCDELRPIVNTINQLNDQVSTLGAFTARMEAEVAAALLNLLASKTGELPCFDPEA